MELFHTLQVESQEVSNLFPFLLHNIHSRVQSYKLFRLASEQPLAISARPIQTATFPWQSGVTLGAGIPRKLRARKKHETQNFLEKCSRPAILAIWATGTSEQEVLPIEATIHHWGSHFSAWPVPKMEHLVTPVCTFSGCSCLL